MKIASYDTPYKKVRVSINPIDYIELRYKNQAGIKELRKLPGNQYALDREGYPVSSKVNISPINTYVNRLFFLNQALSIALMPDSREDLSHEIRNFLLLNKDPRLPEVERQTSTTKRSDVEVTNTSDDFKFSELGSEMDISEAAIAHRDLLGQKRRDINEFFITRQFLFPLAMVGIQSADPAYTATVLGAESFGIKHPNTEIRLASISILDETIKSIWFKFQKAKKVGELPVAQNKSMLALITFEDLNDDLASLETVNSVLTQRKYGVNDHSFDVKNLATLALQNSFKTQKVIRNYLEEQNYKISC